MFFDRDVVSFDGQHALCKLPHLRVRGREPQGVLDENSFGKLVFLHLGEPLKRREGIFSAFAAVHSVLERGHRENPWSEAFLADMPFAMDSIAS